MGTTSNKMDNYRIVVDGYEPRGFETMQEAAEFLGDIWPDDGELKLVTTEAGANYYRVEVGDLVIDGSVVGYANILTVV